MSALREQTIYLLYGLLPILFNITQGGKKLKPTEINESTTLTLKLPAIVTVLIFVCGVVLSIGTLYKQVDSNKEQLDKRITQEQYEKDRAIDSITQRQFRIDTNDNLDIIIEQLETLTGKKVNRKLRK
jgi:hypothetical protein